MRVNGFRCDGCSKEHLLDPTLIIQSYRHELPVDWFMVAQGKSEDKEPWLFCSKGCLREWLTSQITANDIKPQEKKKP